MEADFIGIARHRLSVDGEGVTTLAAFHGCTLRCKYCLNPQSLGGKEGTIRLSPEELYERVKVDELYFLATEGGICFGGGEPCLHTDFIREFRKICGQEWKITIESALNVPRENVEGLIDVADSWIVDVKDMDSAVYLAYTGRDNCRVLENLQLLKDVAERVKVRVPLIKGFNDEVGQERSIERLKLMGFENFDTFEYRIKE